MITGKIKEAFPILNRIDESLLLAYPISCYCIVNKNNQFSIRVSAMNVYVPSIFESLGKTIPPALQNSLDLTERLIIDLNSIDNDNTEVYIDVPDYYSYKLENYQFNIDESYDIQSKLNQEGHHPLSFKFNSLDLVEYSHFLMQESKMQEYKFSADQTLLGSSEIIYTMEPSNEELVNFHNVFDGFDREETQSNVAKVIGSTYSYIMVLNNTLDVYEKT
jgi:hypothetical protein